MRERFLREDEQDRAVVDAVREILGKKPLYSEGPGNRLTACIRLCPECVDDVRQKALYGDGLCQKHHRQRLRAQEKGEEETAVEKPPCSECGGESFSKGLCQKHYQRAWRLKDRKPMTASPGSDS